MKFICDMSTGQTYLGKFMEVFVKKFVSLTFCQKWRIKKKKKLNCGNWIVEIGGVKKKKDCGKINATATLLND